MASKLDKGKNYSSVEEELMKLSHLQKLMPLLKIKIRTLRAISKFKQDDILGRFDKYLAYK